MDILSHRTDLKVKEITKDQKGYFIMIKAEKQFQIHLNKSTWLQKYEGETDKGKIKANYC